ncbi:MAG TPA: hypothetical protein VMH89_12240 [Candidatus Acidoferrum sp.]|nr:hypothetical protein [Candidatus Acidoferrum sp.]
MRRANILNSICLVCLFLAGCSGASSSGTGSNNGTGNSSGVSLTITPVTATVVIQQSAAFQAKVTGTTNTAVTWEVNGIVNGNTTVGTILAGLYTAPGAVPSPASVTVTAVSQANTAVSQSAAVLVVSANQNQGAQSIPVKLGTSGGNANDLSVQGNLIYCCGGTLGSLVQRNGTYFILSNNHVLARSDAASIGDAITQPDLIDANCSTVGTTTVGNLTQYVNLEAGTSNADAAIAQIVSGTVDTSGSILSLGSSAPNGVPDAGPPHAGNGIAASVGETVAKSGRSSGLTCSSIDATTITASVSYQKGCSTGAMFTATYTGQISVQGGAFSAEGDSGSLIVDQKTADPVALLYGGSDTDTVGNPVADVLNALKDSQGNKPTFVGSSATHSVAGCTIASNVVKTAQAQNNVTFTSAQLAQAQHARDMHAPELLANPYIQALGVGASIDHPGEPAVVVVVNPAEVPVAIPQQLEGVATRILQGTSSSPRGIFEPDVAARVAPVADTFAINSLSSTEMARAKTVHSAHVNALMREAGVQGVGITSSADAPGEAALMIFVIRGVTRNPIPVVIDGVRTRVRESSRFTAGNRGNEAPRTGCPVPPMKTAPATSTE